MLLRGIISTAPLPSLRFILLRTISGLSIDHLDSVFVAVGFPGRDPDKIKIALENTYSLLWIECKKTQRPVAFARATGDDVFDATVWDVVVDPVFSRDWFREGGDGEINRRVVSQRDL